MSKSNELIVAAEGEAHAIAAALPNVIANAETSKATARRVNAINRLHEQLEWQLTDAARGCLYTAFRIGRIVDDAQARAPAKKKTAAVEELAANPKLRLSRAQLYRYLRLAKQLPKLLGAPSEELFTAGRKEFIDLVGDLSLPEAWRLLGGQSAAMATKLPGLPEGLSDAASVGNKSTARGVTALVTPTAVEFDDDWQTPTEIIRAAHELFGGIDFDPCGVVNPARHLVGVRTVTPELDSLSASVPWEGRVFVHPPISNIGPFVDRSAEVVASGEVDEALLLIPAETDAAHMAVLQPYARGFLRTRPMFAAPHEELVQPCWPYVLVFLSQFDNRIDAFADACGHLADIYRPYRF